MKNIIIALLFRVTTGKKKLLDKIEYISFTAAKLLNNPDFQDPATQALITKLSTASEEAAEAAIRAESKATADIKERNKKATALNKAYKAVALDAEEICDDDMEKALATGLTLRKKPSVKHVTQPQNLRAAAGKQTGEIDAKCKAQGQGVSYLWYIRKESATAYSAPVTTTKASNTFTGLESGVNYVAYVAAKSSTEVSEASDIVLCRAK